MTPRRAALPAPRVPVADVGDRAVHAFPPADVRLEIPDGATIEALHCSLCGRVAAAAILPKMPELPLDAVFLLRPFVRYAARKYPAARRALDALLAGDFAGMLAALREEGAIHSLLPTVCAQCLGGAPAAADVARRLSPGATHHGHR